MKGRLQWPFHLAVGITLRCRSGHRIDFTSNSIQINVDGFAKIVGYNWQGARDAPLYIDPGAIESVVTDRVIRWRGWRAEPPAPAVVDVEAQAAVAVGPVPDPPTGVKVH